jgi:hypothetical protein
MDQRNDVTQNVNSMPVADDATSFPTWNLTVNDTAPTWAYVSGCHVVLRLIYSIYLSAVSKLLPAIVVLGWSCMFTVPLYQHSLISTFCSAINSVETSDRNFTAFQSVAKAINGTAAAANSPNTTTGSSPTTTAVSGNGATSTRHGVPILLIVSAVLVVAFA